MFVSLLVYYLACARVAPALIGAGRISVQLWLLLQDAATRLSRGPVAIKKRPACKQTQPQRFASSRAALLWLRVQEPPRPDNNGHFPHYAPHDDGVRSLHESSLAKVQQSQESEEFSIFSLSLSSRLRRLRKKGRRRDTFSVRTSQRGFSVRSLLVSTRPTDGGYHA